MKKTNFKNASIGIFDSGFGGLTVLKTIKNLLPNENLVYFGDTARLPYGNKSAENILRFSIENATFLQAQGIKLLVIACHTACSFALKHLQKSLNIPVIGVIAPGVEQVINVTKNGHIAILGTRATISSGVYQDLIRKRIPHAKILAISCPLFVPLVEEGYTNHPLTELTIQEYLGTPQHNEIDTVLLGCTHYPLLQPMIGKHLGEDVVIVDPANACAENVRALLKSKDLLNPQTETPRYEFYVSDDPEKFKLLGKIFLNYPIQEVLSKPI